MINDREIVSGIGSIVDDYFVLKLIEIEIELELVKLRQCIGNGEIDWRIRRRQYFSGSEVESGLSDKIRSVEVITGEDIDESIMIKGQSDERFILIEKRYLSDD